MVVGVGVREGGGVGRGGANLSLNLRVQHCNSPIDSIFLFTLHSAQRKTLGALPLQGSHFPPAAERSWSTAANFKAFGLAFGKLAGSVKVHSSLPLTTCVSRELLSASQGLWSRPYWLTTFQL